MMKDTFLFDICVNFKTNPSIVNQNLFSKQKRQVSRFVIILEMISEVN